MIVKLLGRIVLLLIFTWIVIAFIAFSLLLLADDQLIQFSLAFKITWAFLATIGVVNSFEWVYQWIING